MDFEFIISKNLKIPVYRQIINQTKTGVDSGVLELGDQLPSINEVSNNFQIANATVTKAYEELKKAGVIASQQGKGYFIASTDIKEEMRIFLLFDVMNAYKQKLFDAFIKELNIATSAVRIFFHFYDKEIFKTLIKNNAGRYTHYVIMPHFHDKSDLEPVIGLLPPSKTLMLDNTIPGLEDNYAAVFQNFKAEVYTSLKNAGQLLAKYRKLKAVLSFDSFFYTPKECIDGFCQYCEELQIPYDVIEKINTATIDKYDAYLIFTEEDLVSLVTHCQAMDYQIGKDIGIIAFDETPYKEIIAGGITVISADFEKMGRMAAQILVQKKRIVAESPYQVIYRKSL